LEGVELRRILIRPSRITADQQQLTWQSIHQWKRSTGVTIAYPRIDLSVQVSLIATGQSYDSRSNGLNHEFCSLRGIQGNEPEFATRRLNKPLRLTDQFNVRPDGIVLTDSLYRQLTELVTPSSHQTASEVLITIRRTVQGQTEQQQLRVPILATVDHPGDYVFTSLKMAHRFDQWQRHVSAGSVEDRVADQSAAESRYASAIFYADTIESVKQVVSELERTGFEVEHQLHRLEDLGTLARLLVAVVTLLVSGTVANAFLTALVIGWLDFAARRKEYGIQLAGGMRWIDVLRGIAMENTLVLVIAIASGVVFSVLVEPSVGKHLVAKLGIPRVDTLSLGSEQTIGLILIATAITIVAQSATILPAIFAIRSRTLDLLR